MLEEWYIGSFYCGSRQARFGKEGFCDLFFSFPLVQFIPSNTVWADLFSELLSVIIGILFIYRKSAAEAAIGIRKSFIF